MFHSINRNATWHRICIQILLNVVVTFVLPMRVGLWLQKAWKNAVYLASHFGESSSLHMLHLLSYPVLCLCGESDSVLFPEDRRRKKEKNKKQAAALRSCSVFFSIGTVVVSEKPLVSDNDRNPQRAISPSEHPATWLYVALLFINDCSVSYSGRLLLPIC